jgi:pantetheine-phosphate adenylyltransferase
VVERASRLFDRVVVVCIGNPAKASGMFTMDERRMIVEDCTGHLNNLEAVIRAGLTVEAAREFAAAAIVRGLRTVSDFDSEMAMAQMNHQLSGVETVFLPTDPTYSFVSARLLREIATHGGDISAMVPAAVVKRLEGRQ